MKFKKYIFITICFALSQLFISNNLCAQKQKAFRIKEIYAGFRAPEGAVYDQQRDCYYISNVNGNSTEKDNNGFISKIDPANDTFHTTVLLSGSKKYPLHAPKGMAVMGNFLFVADIDSLVICNIKTEKTISRIKIKNAVFLNDIVIDTDKNMFLTDTKMGFLFKIAYPYKKVKHNSIKLRKKVKGPNGLFIHPLTENIWVTSFYSNLLTELLPSNGSIVSQIELPFSGADGICRGISDERLFVSCLKKGYLVRVNPELAKSPEIIKVNKKPLIQPADICYDKTRARIIIPEMKEGRVSIFSIVR